MTSILAQIDEGMDVLDSSGGKIGTVEFLKMTDEDSATAAPEQITIDPGLPQNRTIIDNLANVFRDDGIPQPLHETMLRRGFLKIDTSGLLTSDRYALPDQIAEVADNKVKLTVSKDELIKRQ